MMGRNVSLTRRWTAGLLALLAAATWAGAQDDEPALPPGLGETVDDEPGLPPGLGGDDEPGLPPGLGGDDEPGLPPGLGGGGDTRSLGTSAEEPSRGLPDWLHGFWDVRGGVRLRDDPAQPRDAILGETRLQLEADRTWDRATLEVTTDIIGDGAAEEADLDVRKVRLTWSPLDALDLRIGRQVLTWGTGDMLFINDLFPKDWVAYFIGRDVEYLKAPSDAIKVGWFTEAANVEVVYTPQFAPDRFIRGDRVSYWDPLFQRAAGRANPVSFNAPSTWFTDDEIALRVYRSFGAHQVALYAYSGYWKSPGGQRLVPFMQARFPKLRVYGASLRGAVAQGIGNVEVGYYDSREDRGGDRPLVNNSEFRLLLGYERELAKDLTGAVQYYLEHMMDHGAYRRTLPFMMGPKDRDRHVFTVRLTKLLRSQTVIASLFAYYSPSDGDGYVRPNLTYKASDAWRLEVGGNVFLGESDGTFFGQFKNNSNAYAAVRYGF